MLVDTRTVLWEEWIRQQFNDFEARLKVVEAQTKGINKSCSKMHQAFESLKKEMVELYHEKDGELKLVKEVLEKVERRCFPELYETGPIPDWILNITAKRPKD